LTILAPFYAKPWLDYLIYLGTFDFVDPVNSKFDVFYRGFFILGIFSTSTYDGLSLITPTRELATVFDLISVYLIFIILII
jgi:hypothetical protein